MPILHALAFAALAALPPVGAPLLAPQPIGPPPPPPLGTPLIRLEAIEAAPAGPRHRWLGAQVDAGLPEGFGGSIVLRPWYFARAHLGAVTNTAAPGIRGGLTLVPFRFPITPALSVEAGHLFEGDLNGTLESVLSKAKMPDGTLDRVSYDFISGELGLEVGAPDRFIVFLRGGISRVSATLHGQPRQLSGSAKLDPGEVKVGLTIPSARLGILLYL